MEKTYTGLADEADEKRNIAELVQDYVETYADLTIVKINQKTADISAVASFTLLGGLILATVFIFLV